ncbi:uncharacterized protein PGTG_14142 [Puccinia graminis f. sp. tritici CRL 75-36-700-3]|uniref:CCHC-type domain-containing protein n=1 Tax=Puccinia graminis f. sp. tritici (strain CRL 75-36-700-3 / race SCCL) TaxID=418459 RepID=E3KX33_PUCGT|nr:uncharacterized protein PGTG_14142 [Puccinia graminis f. sp. tritici CRL 75-36-700-3]EFP88803.1 hypothetical protein PGTG_14142 [Puccinia graminis f. sp. tritici CRL 75-36-700-3]
MKSPFGTIGKKLGQSRIHHGSSEGFPSDELVSIPPRRKGNTSDELVHIPARRKGFLLTSWYRNQLVGTKGRFWCYTCGEQGHHSPKCPTKSNKKQGKASANAAEARTGATSVVTYGNYESQEEDDSFDEEIDVWG